MSEKKVAVIGAGLVGSLLSTLLAKRGFSVTTFEKRADMRKTSMSAGRSINLAISTRGLKAVELIGLKEKVLEKAVPMTGRMMHSKSGELTFQPYGKDPSEHINSISRGELNQLLMTEAERSGAQIYFEKNLDSLSENELLFNDEKTRKFEKFKADLVFGTDGAFSATRKSLLSLSAIQESIEFLDHGYKELCIPAAPGSKFQMEKNALHIWPRGAYMLIALPNFDGSFTVTLFLPFQGKTSFESLQTPEKVIEFFEEEFPDAIPLIPDLTRDFFENPTGKLCTVRTRPWNWKGHALLLGDAAHAIVPFFGQGMNAGFEDCTLLMKSLDTQTSLDWEDFFSQFSEERKPDADAIADLAIENFVEMRDKVGDPHFLLKKHVEKILRQEFPGQYQDRYSLVTFSEVPYRFAYEVGEVQKQILNELCKNLKNAEEVDLSLAQKLIQEKLSPIFHRQN